MRKAVLVALAASLFIVYAAGGVELGPVSLGFHLTPAVQAADGQRAWGLSLSFGATAVVGASSSVEITLVVDSIPSSLGATFLYLRDISSPFTVGAGLNVFWRFESEAMLVRSVIGGFAHASARTSLLADFTGEAGVSFPLITLAREINGWEILPLAELPAVHLITEWQGVASVAVQGRLTLQPVVADTTLLNDPVGRISDDLLVLPTYSVFLRILP
jgi:hypothetical protein